MKSKIELLKEMIGKEVVFEWSEGGSNQFSISDYYKFQGLEFKKEFGHHLILDVSDEMINTKWLGQEALPKYPDRSGYFSIANVSIIFQ